VPENWIQRVSVRRTAELGETFVRAEAECSVSGRTVTIASAGESVRADVVDAEETQLGELRKRLYDAGFSKRAIATAVKNVKRTEH
jgi:hypothetical protein